MSDRPLDFPREPEPVAPPAAADGAAPAVLPRAAVLLGLLVLLDLWSSRHLGIGLATRPAWLGIVMASWLAAFSLLQKLLDDSEVKSLEASLTGRVAAAARRVLRSALLATPVLVALGLGLFVLALSCSSVTITADERLEPDGVRLAVASTARSASDSGAAGSASDPGVAASCRRLPGFGAVVPFGCDPVRFLVRSSLAARTYRLTVADRLPKLVVVPPLGGLRVTADELPRVPVLLLRPPPTALASLQNGGTIEVFAGSGSARRSLAGPEQCNCAASFIVGGEGSPPADAGTRWQLELMMLRGAAPESEAFSRALLAWATPRRLEIKEAFPEAPITAEVRSRARVTVARTAVPIVIGEQPFVDVLMETSHDEAH